MSDPFGGDICFGMKRLSIAKHNRKGERRACAHVLLRGIEHKSCADCASLLPLDNYSHNKNAVDGLYSYCKACDNKRNREAYARKRGAA